MSYLILRTQIEVMRRNLTDVQLLVESLDSHDVVRPLDLPSPYTGTSLDDLYDSVREAQDAVRREDGDALGEALQALELAVEELRASSEIADKKATELADRSPARLTDFQTTLTDELVDKVVDGKLRKLDDLEKDLQEAEELEAQGRHTDANEAVRRVWCGYATEVMPEARDVFGEYVEFLEALALRFTGFDRGICRLADELIRETGQFPGFSWNSVTLPARQETLSMAYMIGLGFPEWTIWTLPLGAHALGQGFIRTNPKTIEFVEENAADEAAKEDLRILLADAFATYLLGPAYACAAILLRLDPYSAFADGALGARRAQVVLGTLRLLSKRDPNRFADHTVDRLSPEWEQALREAGHGDPLDQPDSRGGLSKSEAATVDALVDHIAETVGRSRAYKGSRWPDKVVNWAPRLRDGKIDDIEIDPDDQLKHALRDVLNAAWHCRLELTGKNADLTPIDKAAQELWDKLERAEAPSVRQGSSMFNDARRALARRPAAKPARANVQGSAG
jgi:hypothetical protein